MRRFTTALLVILGVALAVRIAVIVATPDYKPIFDAADYQRHAVSIADGHGYPGQVDAPSRPSAYRPPLYPLALAGVHLVGGGIEAGRVGGALLGVLAVLLIVVIARRLWGDRVAVVAGAVAAVFPPLVFINASLLSETLFLPLVLASLLAVLVARDTGRLRWAAAAGALCGLAALTRSNGVLLVPGAMIGVWTLRPLLSRRALVAPLVVALAALVTLTPWMVRNAVEFHRFVGISTQGGYGLAGTYNPESRRAGHPGRPQPAHQLRTFRDIYEDPSLDESERAGKLTRRGIDYAVDNPRYVAETMFWNTLRVFDVARDGPFGDVYPVVVLQGGGLGPLPLRLAPLSLYAVLLLCLLGVAAQLGLLPSRRAPAFVWAFPLLMVVPAVVIWGLARYRAPVDPFLIMLAAVGVVAAYDRVTSRLGDRDAVLQRAT